MYRRILQHIGLWLPIVLLCVAHGEAPLERAAALQPAGAAIVYPSSITIDTYHYAGYIREAYNSAYNVSYPVLDWDAYRQHTTHAPQTYETLVLENDYLRLTVIPALGGRVYSLVFKPTGHNELYSNPVIKPTRWGPPEQGWWLAAGGIEWCLPVDEHGYEWGVPWAAETGSDAAGAYIVLRDTIRTDRLRAAVTLRLPHDRAVLQITPRLENPAASGFWFKYWTNAQLAPGPANTLSADFRFILPTSEVTIHSTGDSRLPGPGQAMGWPWYNGSDLSSLGTWNEWIGFFARPAAQRDFQGAYDTGVDEGLARVFPAAVARGAKGFAWGWNRAYPAYHWTDGPATYYAEIHGGLAPTFWDQTFLPPGGAVEWTESWYPVAGIGGLTTANGSAALHLGVAGSQVTLGAQPTAAYAGARVVLWRRGDLAPLHVAQADLSPGAPYRAALSPGGALDGLVLTLLDGEGRLLATTDPAPDRWPPAASVSALPPYVTAPGDMLVSWAGADAQSAVLAYDVQVRDGYDGAWTDWLAWTTATSARYLNALPGHTYFFRARARDVYGNVSGYGGDEWGQAFCSLLPAPAPVLVTSRKGVDRVAALPGQAVSYTLSLRNTGSADAAAVRVTDTLPAELTLVPGTLQASSGGPPQFDAGTISWLGAVPAGGEVEIRCSAQVQPEAAIDLRRVNNIMVVEHQGAPFSRPASFILGYTTFFPLLFRE